MIRIIIIRNLIILKGEIMTFHYMVMANHAIYNRMLMEILEETGLTAGQPKVLDYLGYHDGASQKEIAAHCYIEAATLTSVLNGMEAKALIDELLSLENPYNCPHGRPTIISMSKYELEKKFKRIV